MTNQYLTILAESLQKKSKVLDDIQAYNEKQYLMFKEDQVSFHDFDEYVEEKGKLIEQLNGLDEGFESLYQKISQELAGHKEDYAPQIRILQQLIKEVTDKSVSVQAQEARNKQLVEQYFRKAKDGVRQRRQSSTAAMNYYKNMSNTNVIPPQFMDQKK